jgi:acyl transferase domain-containing protein
VCAGKETVKFFAKEELDPRVDASDPAYVAARGVLEHADRFDAAFFGEPPAFAELMDPQQRILLELSVAALEDAGVVPERHGGSIGVFAGSGHNTYLLKNVVYRLDKLAAVGDLAVILGNDKDFVATRIAHKLNLTGPAVSVHTACSTSLVAVCQAYRSLLDYECDVALAGAASVTVPQQAGHVYAEGAMLSSDGHTRTFDAAASGTVFSDGAGMVVLKRLSDAQRDGDRIYAVIRGAAINNDGAAKASYTAPSVAGQAAAIAMAHAVSGVDPETITYVEAHGTATPLGDPVEIEALTQAFRARTERRGFCAIGSIKSNIGHATAASGVAGLIKTALCASTAKLAPSLFFDRPNPNIDFSATPFFVQTKLVDWTPPAGVPRRAGVSSFGVGGTNAHVVVEEPPAAVPTGAARGTELVVISAKTEAALARRSGEIANFLETEPAEDLADVAYTLAARRTHYAHRRFVVGRTRAEAIASLRALPDVTTQRKVERRGGPVAFMFPGQGAQYVGMGRAIYETEPVFKLAVDRCAEILRPLLGRDLREVVFPDPKDAEGAEAALRQTMFTQPALFTIEYALASLWQSWSIEPAALVGHSVGEFVGACLAGVFSLESAASLVGQRGSLMQSMPPGSMLSVRAAADAIERRLPPGITLAASNGPALCVVAGPKEPIERLRDELDKEGIVAKLLFTSHAFHSEMMEPVVLPFAEEVRRAKPAAPKIPIISTATGALLTPEQATDPMYWARHLRQPVRFTEALRTLWSDPSLALLEVGPRSTCATLARQIVTDRGKQIAIASLEDRVEAEWPSLLRAAGQLWLGGASIDWEAIQAIGRRRLVSLPAYPFARDRHWLEPAEARGSPLRAAAGEPLAAPPVPIAGTFEDMPAMGSDASADVLVGVVSAQLQLMQAQLEALQRAEAGEVNTAAEE